MNNKILKKNPELSNKYYFQSLLFYLSKNNILTQDDLNEIHYKIMNLLSTIVHYYTKEESESLPIDIAEKLLLSINYNISAYLKSINSFDEQIKLLKEKDVDYLYTQGKIVIEEKFNAAKILLEDINKKKLIIDNYAYLDTIDGGIQEFFNGYDIRFFTTDTQGSIDYPLCIDKMDLEGVEYIYSYLFKFNLEDEFCRNFKVSEILLLLFNYEEEYPHLLINIFEIVLCNAIAIVLLERELTTLQISSYEVEMLYEKMKDYSGVKIQEEIYNAVEIIINKLNIKNMDLVDYLELTATKISEIVEARIHVNNLEDIFICVKNRVNDKIDFEDGKPLSNIRFSIVVDEINSCNDVKDKIKIINSKISSVFDLVDVLNSDCIYNNEYYDIFDSFNEIKLAFLAKEIDNYTEEWHIFLNNYLENINEEKKNKILLLSKKINLI